LPDASRRVYSGFETVPVPDPAFVYVPVSGTDLRVPDTEVPAAGNEDEDEDEAVRLLL